jgi:uncharacterized protein (DUF58 family)
MPVLRLTMIIPRTRLLVWVAIVVLPFGVAVAITPHAWPVAVIAIVCLTVVAGVDASVSRSLLSRVSVKLPQVMRFSKDRPGRLPLQFENESGQSVEKLRVGLPWPREIDAQIDEMFVALPADGQRSEVEWPCVPRQRGRYPLENLFIETPSRLGFWAMRKTAAVSSELRVYPNLLSERRAVASLFLNRGTFGVHRQRQVGKGREFEKLREYIAGDAIDDIHWKASAKRGHPVTKIYQIERTQEVYVVIDASRLSARTIPDPAGNRKDSTLERFIVAGLILGLAAEQQGDLFGLLAFSDRVESFIPARNGQQHYNACRDALYTLQPRALSPDFEELMTFIRLRLRRRALVVFLTALDDAVLGEQFAQSVELVARRHVVLVNMLQPEGVQPLFSEQALAGMDQLYERLAGHLRWSKLRELQKMLKRRGVTFSTLPNENLAADLISQYLNMRQRQIL